MSPGQGDDGKNFSRTKCNVTAKYSEKAQPDEQSRRG